VVVLEDSQLLSASEEEEQVLVEAVERLQDDDTVFVVWEGALGKRDLGSPFFKAIKKSKYVFEFASWNTSQVAGWMANELQQKGVAIDSTALQHLSLSVQDNLWLAKQEVAKLAAYAKAQQLTMIDSAAVRLLIPQSAQDDMFGFVDAVTKGDQAQSLGRLHQQLDAGTHELQVLSMLGRQFRILQQIKSGLAQGMNPDAIAKAYGIHPFVVKKLSALSGQLTEKKIEDDYGLLTDLDVAVKSSGLSGTVCICAV